jgi:hypothetical protein
MEDYILGGFVEAYLLGCSLVRFFLKAIEVDIKYIGKRRRGKKPRGSVNINPVAWFVKLPD